MSAAFIAAAARRAELRAVRRFRVVFIIIFLV